MFLHYLTYYIFNLLTCKRESRGATANKVHILTEYHSFWEGPKVAEIGQVANPRPSLSNRSFVQNEPQDFLPYPEVVCAYVQLLSCPTTIRRCLHGFQRLSCMGAFGHLFDGNLMKTKENPIILIGCLYQGIGRYLARAMAGTPFSATEEAELPIGS